MTKSTDNIRRLKNGAIDTAYYVRRGHVIRSQAAYQSLNGIRNDAAHEIRSFKSFIRKFAEYRYFGIFAPRRG